MVSLASEGAVPRSQAPAGTILKGTSMNLKSVAAVLAAFAVGTALLVPTVASAQTVTTEEHNTYFAIKFGPYFPSETNGLNAIGNTFEKWPTKYEVDGALGAYWGIFGLQLNAGYLTTGSSDVDSSTASARGRSCGATFSQPRCRPTATVRR